MIKVLIERHIAPDLSEHYDLAAMKTLQTAMQAHGYISGEVLHNVADTNHRLLIVHYRTIQDWQRWYHSEERREMMSQLAPMLETEERITVFEH